MRSLARVGPRRAAERAFAPALALAGLAAAALADGVELYEFDVPMAPVCVDGSFPVTIYLPGAGAAGTLVATTGVSGRVTGTLDLGDGPVAISGKVKHRADGSSLRFTAGSGPARISFRGTFEPGAFAGIATGAKDSAAPGKNPFGVDVSAADPQVAVLTALLDPGTTGRVTGSGDATVCGAPLDLSVRGKRGKSFTLDLRAKGFRWKGSADGGGDDAMDWTIKGYGARLSGEGLALSALPPPADLSYEGFPPLLEQEEPAGPFAATVGGGPVRTWSVDPPLPPGLALDPVTGEIGGTPIGVAAATVHTITAANPAGSVSTEITFGVRVQRAYSLAPHAEALTDDDLRHFLVRTHFGVRVDELAAVAAQGLGAYVDGMLDFTPDQALEDAAKAWLANASDPPGLEGGFPSPAQLSRWWVFMMMNGDHPFRENLAVFWQDHFAVSTQGLAAEQRFWMVDYVNLFRHGGAGDLRALLVGVARDPAMLNFLDGLANTATRPNENFAREFWELYTLGVDNGYTQEDILEAARAFTGYRARINVDTNQYYVEFSPGRHDPGPKTIFGVVIPAQDAGHDDFQAVVDITLAERPVAEFLCRKLLRWYCLDDPAEALVSDMAAVLRASDWHLAPALRAMFLSEAFFSKRARRSLAKSPVDFGVGFVRSTGLVVAPNALDSYLALLGQRPTEPPTVDGWPAGTLWFTAAAMVDRTNLALHVAVLDAGNQGRAGISVADALPPAGQRSAGQVVDHLAALLRADITAEDRADLVSYLDTVRTPDGAVVPSPFDGNDQAHLDERVRGLLYVLAQHPAYHLR